MFAGLESLEMLSINDNAELVTVPEHLFADLESLKILVVSFNNLAEPRASIFLDLKKLESLTTARKQLTTLPQGLFSGLDSLSFLSLTLAGDERNELPHQVTTEMSSHGERNIGQHGREPTQQNNNLDADIKIAKTGATLVAFGEPKSGTTWIGSIITELAVQLCGHSTNGWCHLGYLRVSNNDPGPWYDFEMVSAGTRLPLLNFQGKHMHPIPGLDVTRQGCNPRGRPHRDSFETLPACTTGEPPTRTRLLACLPDTSPPCDQYLPPLDPAMFRMVVVVRDPRNVVISEHRMRKEVYWEMAADLDIFIHERFETIVAWMHQRWVWHTTTLKASSDVMFFEDLEVDHLSLVHLAAFMGLECSPEQALDIWTSTRNASPHGSYTAHELPSETVEWMNATMSALLPVPMLTRWGLTATHL